MKIIFYYSMGRGSWKKLMIQHLELTRRAVNFNMTQNGHHINLQEPFKINNIKQAKSVAAELQNTIKFPYLSYLRK